MTNFEDTRLSVRVHPELKRWLDERGASKFVRRIILAAYKQLEGKEFIVKE